LKDSAHWTNYFLCGYKAILALNENIRSYVKKPVGMKILIDSQVPPAAGLSSSSAFVVCAAITTMYAN
jgi:galactokinase